MSSSHSTDSLFRALHRLPKIDLHTHMNGSISNACLQHLASLLFGADSATASVFEFTHEEGDDESPVIDEEVAVDDDDTKTAVFGKAAAMCDQLPPTDCAPVVPSAAASSTSALPADPSQRMHYCFKVFDAIYKVMNNLDFTRAAVQDVLFHYFCEGAVYVEIRTSLRVGMHKTFAEHKDSVDNNATASSAVGSATQWDYWQAVTEAIADCLTLVEVCPTSRPIRLPAVVSPLPPFAVVRPTAESLLSTAGRSPRYTEALDAWLAIYGGGDTRNNCMNNKASYIVAYIRALKAEAEAAAEALLDRATPPTPTTATDAIDALRVRMLISLSRGQSMADNEATGALIPIIMAADAAHLKSHMGATSSSPTSSSSNIESLAQAAMSCVFPLLVGIDLGGNAYKGDLGQILALLGRLRSEHGLPLTLHGGEKKDDGETAQMIAFGPERWGHLVFISDEHREQLQRSSSSVAAVELCLTSNMITSGSDDVTEHHISSWLECVKKVKRGEDANEHKNLSPFTISFKGNSHVSLHTDDRGVFAASMTKELWLFSCHREVFPEGGRASSPDGADKDGASSESHSEEEIVPSPIAFGPLRSQQRCDALFPLIKELHRKAVAVAFVPPVGTVTQAAAAIDGGIDSTAFANAYRAAAYAHFDRSCVAAGV